MPRATDRSAGALGRRPKAIGKNPPGPVYVKTTLARKSRPSSAKATGAKHFLIDGGRRDPGVDERLAYVRRGDGLTLLPEHLGKCRRDGDLDVDRRAADLKTARRKATCLVKEELVMDGHAADRASAPGCGVPAPRARPA